MKLGITQYTACQQGTSGTKVMEIVAGLGLEGVELVCGSTESEFYNWSSDQIAQLVARGRELGVSVPSTGLGLFNNDPALVEASGRQKAVGIITRMLEQSAAAGAKVMLLCSYIQSHPDTPEKKSNLMAVVREILPLATELGIDIAHESPIPAEELAEVVDGADSEHVGVYYDVGNAVWLGYDPAREIEVLGSRIRTVHIKDTLERLGDSRLGAGRVDLGASMDALRKVGYDGWLMFETPGGDEAGVRADIEVLKRYL